MPARIVGRLAGQFHQAFGSAAHVGLSDADLLARFRADRDPAAIEAIVCRHGPCGLPAGDT